MREKERERVSDINYCGPKIGEADSTGLTGPAKFYPVVFLSYRFKANGHVNLNSRKSTHGCYNPPT